MDFFNILHNRIRYIPFTFADLLRFILKHMLNYFRFGSDHRRRAGTPDQGATGTCEKYSNNNQELTETKSSLIRLSDSHIL